MCPGAGRIAGGVYLADDELELIRRVFCEFVYLGQGGAEVRTTSWLTLLSSSLTNVFGMLFNWGVGSGGHGRQPLGHAGGELSRSL